MEINIYSLGSGSKGNCVVLTDGKTGIMIDAGLSARAMATKLKEIGLRIEDLRGVLLTHEHNDHIKSIPLVSNYLPIYSHSDTLDAVSYSDGIVLGSLNNVEKPFELGGFEITPFNTSHDAVHPYGFIVNNGQCRVGYVTDSGYISKGIMKSLLGCNKVVMESNHDKELLIRGIYPERLKRRILSDKGHLSNEETALCVCDLAKSGTKKFLLAHISENNNLTELAYWTTVKMLQSKGMGKENICVKVAMQRDMVIL